MAIVIVKLAAMLPEHGSGMELRHLRYFDAEADGGSTANAGTRRNLR